VCGLAGFINFRNGQTLASLANEAQAHRGPDNYGSWSDEFVTFAHQRLSIIDLSERSNQPFIKDGFIVIFNGEIYNYHQVRQQIVKEAGVNFTSDGDTEVVLEAYRHWGVSCFNHFIGMFAFAIYQPEKNELIIARDHFGIKPLFYIHQGGQFAFSSELKTLTKLPGFQKQINQSALLSALNYVWVSTDESMFKGCFKLKPGHYLKLNVKDLRSVKETRYWQVEPSLVNRSEAEWTEMLCHQLEATIDRHMVSDVPVSSFLSGGLDSSLISVLAKRKTDRLSTFTIATGEKDKAVERMPEDEKYAAQVARKFGFDHHEIVINPTIVDDLPRMVRTLDEPIGDPAALNTYLICQSARQMGVKVLLSGMGADELFLGYRRQQATLLAHQYQKIPAFARTAIKAGVGILPVKVGSKGIKWSRWLKRFISFSDLPIEQAYRRSYSYYDDAEYAPLLQSSFSREIQQLNEQHHSIFYEKKDLDLGNRMCYTDIQMFMLGLNLTYTDRASMAASVEVRVPFIDREMVEFAMSIPANLKFKNGQGKYILKKAAERTLPHDIIYRQKASFGAPIRSWISTDLKPMIDEVLSEASVKKRGIFNYGFIKRMIDQDRAGKADYAYQIYQLVTIELWFREFYDK
jgi:asparagine synthase (glutamine-hydrolysing)